MSSDDSLAAMADNVSRLFKSVGQQTSASEQNLVLVARGLMRLLAAPLVAQMGITETATGPVSLLDSACGSGVFTQEMQALMPGDVLQASSFICADSSAGMVDLVKKRIDAEGWVNTEAKVLDAMDTGLPTSSFSHVAIALGLHLIPEPDAVLKDCIRILKPGGIFGATTFPSSNGVRFWYPDMRSAFQSLPFDAPCPDEVPMQMHKSGRWYDAEWVEEHLRAQGFTDVVVKVNPGSHRVGSAAEFVATFGMMAQWLMNTFWSEETREAHPVEEVLELIEKHLEEKHGGKGWEVDWLVISMTGVAV